MFCPSCGAKNENNAQFCADCGGNMEKASSTAPPPPQPAAPGPSAPPPPPPPRPSSAPSGGNVDIGGWISKGLSEAMSDFLNYFLIGLVVMLASTVTAGILAGPLFAGALIVIRRKLRGQGTLDVGAVFNEGFKFFVPAFVFVFVSLIALAIVIGVLQVVPALGQLVGVVIGGFAMVYWAIGLHYITEEKQDFMPAAQSAWKSISQNLLMLWLFGLVVSIISGLGAIACGIGVFWTSAAGVAMMAIMLESMFHRS